MRKKFYQKTVFYTMDLKAAYDKAYHEVAKIQCEKLFHRHDIGKKDM